VRKLLCLFVPVAVAVAGAGSAGAVTITSWQGGKGSVPMAVTAGGFCPATMTTIRGSGFVADGGIRSVMIGGAPASQIIVGSDSVLFARVATGAKNGPVSVTTARGTATASTQAEVIPCQSTGLAEGAPTIGTVTHKVRPGKKFRLLGSGFIGTSAVKVNGLPAAYAIPSDGLMWVIMPADAKAGVATVTVTNNKGTAKVVTAVVGAASS
jgi:hypothetical protein